MLTLYQTIVIVSAWQAITHNAKKADKMFSINDYGDTVLDVVDCFGNLVQKRVVRESGDDSQLVPIRAIHGYIEYSPKNVYWVTK